MLRHQPSDFVSSLFQALAHAAGFPAMRARHTRPQESAATRRGGRRSRRLGYESLEGRVVLSASPGAIITGTVYNDLTGAGQTSDGPGMANVTVKLWSDGGDGKFEGSAAGSDDTLAASTSTNSGGGYSFTGLAAGTYFVQEVLPTGYQADSSSGTVQTVVVSSNAVQGTPGPIVDSFTTTQQVTASSLTTSSQALTVPATEAIGGYRDEAVQLTSSSGQVNLYANLYTPNVLEYDSTATATGSGTVTWDGNSIANPTTLNPTGLNHADLTGGGKSTGITLDIGADHDNATVTLKIYTDAGDWSTVTEDIPYTAGEATEPLYIPYSSFTTGSGSGATFSNVGAVQVTIVGDSGAHAVISSIGAVGPTYLTTNFGDYQPASVGTFAFWDVNANGVKDSGDPAAANVGVQLIQGGNVVATTTTNAQGNYSFTGLAPGSYSVKFVPGNGTLFTAEEVGSNPAVNSDVNPATGISPTFSLTSGQNDSTVDAGLLPVTLSITKMVSNPTPNQNSNVTFTITVSDAAGASPATGVTVSDLLPAGLTFVSDTAGQGTYNSSTGVWNVGNLASGGSSTLTVIATVTGSGTITNTATVTGSDEVDNSPPSALTASATVAPVQPADLQIVKTVNNATPNVGQNVTFTLTLTDLGPGPGTNIVTTDLLPAGLTYVSSTASQGSYNSSTGLWTVGNLADDANATLQITATVITPGTKTNTATITSEGEPDTNPNNNTSTVTVTPQQADLAITKTVNNATPNVGQDVTFSLLVTNLGPNNATNAVITDKLPAGLTFVSDTASEGSYNPTTGVWTAGTVGTGTVTPVTLTIVAQVATPGAKTNTATVTADQYDPNLSNNTSSATVTPQESDLVLTKTVDDSTPSVGQNVTFTVTVSNSGVNTATNVVTTDSLPAGLTFVSDTATQGSYDAGTGIWTIGTLPVGTPVTLTVVANVATQGTKVNTATVTSDQYDPNINNNTGTATVTPQAEVDLTLTKSVDNPAPNVGDAVVFTITVSNAVGEATATGLQLSDLLPAGLTFAGDSTSQGTYNPATGIWNVGILPAGGTAAMSIAAIATTPGIITNTVSVNTVDEPDPNGGLPASATVIPLPVTPPQDNPTPVPTPQTPPVMSKFYFLGR